jgi:hypothetical protein
MKIWKIAVIVTLAVALVLGMALPGLAASDAAATQTTNSTNTDEPPAWGKKLPRILRGEVTEIGDESFDIQTGEQEETIYVSEGTKYFIVSAPKRVSVLGRLRGELGQPGKPESAPNVTQPNEGKGRLQGIRARLLRLRHLGEKATFADLKRDDKVVVLLVPGEDKPTAQVVLIIRPSVWGQTAGTIKRVSDDKIAIEPVSGGDVVILKYNENTTFILKGIIAVEAGAEQFARAVYNTDTTMARVVRVWPEAPQPAS